MNPNNFLIPPNHQKHHLRKSTDISLTATITNVRRANKTYPVNPPV